jgi:hypothetical protein
LQADFRHSFDARRPSPFARCFWRRDGLSARAATRKPLLEERAMLTEFFSIAWRGGIALALVLVALQASGLLH